MARHPASRSDTINDTKAPKWRGTIGANRTSGSPVVDEQGESHVASTAYDRLRRLWTGSCRDIFDRQRECRRPRSAGIRPLPVWRARLRAPARARRNLPHSVRAAGRPVWTRNRAPRSRVRRRRLVSVGERDGGAAGVRLPAPAILRTVAVGLLRVSAAAGSDQPGLLQLGHASVGATSAPPPAWPSN